ncbi:cytochrome P450 family protein [Dothidotthia symphoricarpi CBS 119687]|uniref:Cytochrome P450 family protein n=1 Tax=Dothidotthia symphoricarpi CBS 119687 TaxID=1392245 RepID=A0A6A6AAV9_9PLEO|nr:cytochrome P450 family protein [Dothidotthia symphoricarpi CBS 119687]KAF2127841.1 cytochrome P450 family protein [Dothidotthia symphoricarpi CBS 119687]
MAIFTYTNITISLISLFLARRVYWEVTTGSRRRALSSHHACQPPKGISIWTTCFGLKEVLSDLRAVRTKKILSNWANTLRSNNTHTFLSGPLTMKVFHTDDPENIKAVLATNFQTWGMPRGRVSEMTSLFGHAIFTNEGAAWKHSREMLRPCFERSQVADVSLLAKHVNSLIRVVPMDGSTVDLQPLFFEFTLDVASEFLFGRSTGWLDREERGCDEDASAFVEAFEYCMNPYMSENFKKYGILGFVLPDGKRKRFAKLIRDFANKLVEKRISAKATEPSQSENRHTFLDELLASTQNRTTISSELLHLLLAGRDTTASLLSNLLWELPRHPAILSRLRQEITEHIGDETPTYEQLKSLKYLRAIINESQRIYPIVPANSREALTDTILPRGGGPDGTSPVLVPKGSYVNYYTHAMHHRTDVYGADADEFKPERWLDPGFRPGWAYIPFSGGPRVCIGQNFALTEVSFVVVRLLQMFDVEQRDFGEWKEKVGFTCTGYGGCKVGLKRRVG